MISYDVIILSVCEVSYILKEVASETKGRIVRLPVSGNIWPANFCALPRASMSDVQCRSRLWSSILAWGEQ